MRNAERVRYTGTHYGAAVAVAIASRMVASAGAEGQDSRDEGQNIHRLGVMT